MTNNSSYIIKNTTNQSIDMNGTLKNHGVTTISNSVKESIIIKAWTTFIGGGEIEIHN